MVMSTEVAGDCHAAAMLFNMISLIDESDYLPDSFHECVLYLCHNGKGDTLVRETTKYLANTYWGRPGGRLPRITLVY